MGLGLFVLSTYLHDVERWEVMHQVVLLTCSNRFLNGGGFLLLRARSQTA